MKSSGRLYSECAIISGFEDVLIGSLLHEDNVPFDFVVLNDTRAFEVNNGLRDSDKMAICPHKTRGHRLYLIIASSHDVIVLREIEAFSHEIFHCFLI